MINGPNAMQQAYAERQAQVGGDWFFWIAGVSLVSAVLAFVGTSVYTALGLGTTQFIDALASGQGGTGAAVFGKGVALGLNIFASAFYALYGFFARRGAKWAFVVGGIFYLLDGVLLVVFQSWIGAAFHAYALYRIFQGFQAAQVLGAIRAQQAAFGNTGYVPPSSMPRSDVWPPPPGA